MANPNIVNVTSILGKTYHVAVGTTVTSLLNNAASSGSIIKVNSLYVANIDGANAASVTVNFYSEDDLVGTATAIASTIQVPANASVVIIDKSTSLYLEEDKSIGAIASALGDLVATISYEIIS